MKKILLALFFLPLMLGVNGKNPVKTDTFTIKTPVFSYVSRSNSELPFLDYWVEYRTAHPNVCDITREEFIEMYDVYLALSIEERNYVNEQEDVDEGYTIGQVIRSLVNTFYPNKDKVKAEKQKLDQSSIIVIASVVALVGASAISVLFILKNNKVIK